MSADLERLVPREAVDAELGRPVELDKVALAGGVEEREGVDAEALHHAVGARDAAVGHGPHYHVRS